ncbi:hypothetical protein CCOS2040_26310 [Streptomyces albidoflavus]|nr:hypothetical protein CCOS2040_26310 [Streptomyces albidoflavus]
MGVEYGLSSYRWKASEDHQSLVGTGLSLAASVTFGVTGAPVLVVGPVVPGGRVSE